MRSAIFVLFLICTLANAASAHDSPHSVTVPITLDHNRIIIEVFLPLPDGNLKRVRAWVDTGNPDMWIAESAAKEMGLEVFGKMTEVFGVRAASSPAPKHIIIGDMPIDLSGIREATVMMGSAVVLPGLGAEINLPSTALRNYDVVIDYPMRAFVIAQRGTIRHKGLRGKIHLNSDNALIQIAARIDGWEGNLGFDVGASFSFLSSDLVAKLHQRHARWPHMTGAAGDANLWGLPDEPNWDLLRIPELHYGPVVLKQAAVASFAADYLQWFEKRAGIPTGGLIGGNALLDYRIGIDYANGALFFNHSGRDPAQAMDIVGLILRPEANERYTVIGVASFDGSPSVTDVKPGDVLISVDRVAVAGKTMGQVWSLLRGRPGDSRMLTLERNGKQITVKANIRRFLAMPPSGRANRRMTALR